MRIRLIITTAEEDKLKDKKVLQVLQNDRFLRKSDHQQHIATSISNKIPTLPEAQT